MKIFIGWSQYIYIENLTQKNSLQELEEIKNLFQQMIDEVPEFKDFVYDKIISYNLAFDYGMGAINICTDKNGVIRWDMEFK